MRKIKRKNRRKVKMLVNFKAEFKGFKGELLRDEEKHIITLGDICVSFLAGVSQKEQSLSGKEKMQRYQLAMKINAAMEDTGELEIKAEDVTLLKNIIGEKGTPMVVGQAWTMLDPAESPK